MRAALSIAVFFIMTGVGYADPNGDLIGVYAVEVKVAPTAFIYAGETVYNEVAIYRKDDGTLTGSVSFKSPREGSHCEMDGQALTAISNRRFSLSATELGAGNTQHFVVVRCFIGRNVLGAIFRVDHHLERHHRNTNLLLVLFKQFLSIIRTVERLAI